MTIKADWYFRIIVLAAGMSTAVLAQNGPAVMIDISACIELPEQTARNTCYQALAEEARSLRVPATASGVPAASHAEVAVANTAQTASASTADPAGENSAEPAAASTPQPAAESTAETAVASFGISAPADTAEVVDGEQGRAELHDRIVDLQEREPGRWLITLASGQVWYQSNSGRIRLRKNMDVRIYPSPLGGSYRLAGTEGSTGFIQVARVK